MMAEGGSLFFEAVGLEKKYRTLMWGGVLFILSGVSFMFGTFTYFNAQGAYAEDAAPSIFPLLPFFLIFIPLYGYKIFMKGVRLKFMLKRSEKRGLALNEKGVAGTSLLLEGVYSDKCIASKVADFSFAWADIHNFIVEPVRGSKSYGSPPYYKITFEGMSEKANASCFILRDYFKAHEAEIIKFVKKALGKEHVILNDEIKKD